MKILAAIPTYNNELTISRIVHESLKTGLNILVINDGSTDRTVEKLTVFSEISTITIARNSGKGNALREAFKWAVKNTYTHLITIDADGQHDPAEIPKFIKCIGENEDCLIIGCRNFSSSEIPFASRFGRKCSNLAFRIITGISAADTQSGFRVYPVNKLSTLISNKNKYDFEMDMLLNAALSGIQIKEIPISVSYTKEIKRKSSFNPISDSIRIARPIFLTFLNKLK